MLGAVHDKEYFSILVERHPDGTLDIGSDCTLSPEASGYLCDDHFCDAPTEPGVYWAHGVAEYWSHPGDWYNPPEEDSRAYVERYVVFDPERETVGLWS